MNTHISHWGEFILMRAGQFLLDPLDAHCLVKETIFCTIIHLSGGRCSTGHVGMGCCLAEFGLCGFSLLPVSLRTPLPSHHIMTEHKDYQKLREFLPFSRICPDLDNREIRHSFILYK